MDIDGGTSGEFPAIVPLNLGGIRFTTSLETLQGGRFCNGGYAGAAESMLSAMFSGRIPTRRDSEGRYFIDRDGRHFHHILNYLRDGKYPVALSFAERFEVAREAAFYGLEALAAHLRADLRMPGGGEDACDPGARPAEILSAAEASESVLNRCLEDWPEFPQYVQEQVLRRLLSAGGLPAQGGADATGTMPQFRGGVVLDENSAATLQADTLAAVQIELAHVTDSKVWRWSDRKGGVNSVLRAKLLRCHLQRLGYGCRIVPLLDKKEVCAYVLQVEMPMPL